MSNPSGAPRPTAAGSPAGAGRPITTPGMLVRYKAWANELAFSSVMAIPEEEALKPRMTTFRNMVHTLNHVFVVDDIFRHHLTGRPHGYAMRNTVETPPLRDLWVATQEMDRWYVDTVDGWSADDLGTVVEFVFAGGGNGAMTKEEIILHVVNHASYHRGFVGDMLKQVPYNWPANDLTVFLRDHFRPGLSSEQQRPEASPVILAT